MLRMALVAPMDRIDPTEPIDRIDPNDPILTIEPAEPMPPIEPTLPMEPTEPAEPMENAERAEHRPDGPDAGRVAGGCAESAARTRPQGRGGQGSSHGVTVACGQ